jgi:hypothetical protein
VFVNSTTFVLGAGASWHYGYPTGEPLAEEVLLAAQKFDVYLQSYAQYGQFGTPAFIQHCCDIGGANRTRIDAFTEARRLCSELTSRLRAADPLVIDYFLGHNPELADIGRLLISWVLHHREYQTRKAGINVNRLDSDARPNDNWCRFIVSRLTSGCENSRDLLRNQVRFVTFNYDLSLEQNLYKGLTAHSAFGLDDVAEFLSGDRIIHVYGCLGGEIYNPAPLNFDRLDGEGRSPPSQIISGNGTSHVALLDTIWNSAASLRVIDPINKTSDQKIMLLAREYVNQAVCLYLLGFGFDPHNSERIGLDSANIVRPGHRKRAIMFTNYLGSNRVSKRAGNLFCANFRKFLDEPLVGSPQDGSYCEMSVRNVYEALSLDFDDLEDQLLGGSSV